MIWLLIALHGGIAPFATQIECLNARDEVIARYYEPKEVEQIKCVRYGGRIAG